MIGRAAGARTRRGGGLGRRDRHDVAGRRGQLALERDLEVDEPARVPLLPRVERAPDHPGVAQVLGRDAEPLGGAPHGERLVLVEPERDVGDAVAQCGPAKSATRRRARTGGGCEPRYAP